MPNDNLIHLPTRPGPRMIVAFVEQSTLPNGQAQIGIQFGEGVSPREAFAIVLGAVGGFIGKMGLGGGRVLGPSGGAAASDEVPA